MRLGLIPRDRTCLIRDNSLESKGFRSLSEAIEVLSSTNGQVKPLAGGTDLIAQMKMGQPRPAVVLDVKRIPELLRLEYSPAEGMHIGAAVSCTDVAGHEAVGAHYPAIREAALLVGSYQIQNRATIGGNVTNAAPSADTVPPLLVYGATALIAGRQGQRSVPLEAFFTGPGRTILEPGELLVEVVVPPPPPRSASSYLRFIPRNEMDIAVAGVASMVALGAQGNTIELACIALAAVAPTPVRASAAEAVLAGREASEENVKAAAEAAVEAASPISDVRGSAAYRRELVKVLTRRTLRQCLERLAA